MTLNTNPTLLGGQTQIDIRAIERELNELWKSAAEQADDEREMVTRACTLNLIAVTRSQADETMVSQVLDQLTLSHPNRAIVVNLSASKPVAGEPLIEAWVQAHCQLPVPGRPQVCGEQITIVARGEGQQRVPGTILPLLVPDLPVMIWYPRGEPFRDLLFERLAELADRVIVDSEGFVDPEGGLRRLATWVAGRIPAGDLAWGRLTLWRELVAQCFDTPSQASMLATTERVRMTYGAHSSRVPVLLLASWMIARLNWKQVGTSGPAEALQISLRRSDGGETMVELVRLASDEPHIASVEISGPEMQIRIAPGTNPGSLLTRITRSGRPDLLRSSTWHMPDQAELMAAELRLLNRDKPYEEVLQVAAHLE